MSFRRKLHLVLILLVGASSGILVFLSLHKINALAFELIQEKVFAIAVSTAPVIDGDKVAELRRTRDQDSSLYQELQETLVHTVRVNGVGGLPIRFAYIMTPLPDGEWEYLVDAETDGEHHSPLGEKVEFYHEREKPDPDKAQVGREYTRDNYGTWLTAFAPILTAAGENVGMLGIDIAAQRIDKLLLRLLMWELLAMIIAIGLAATLAIWLSKKITRPLTELHNFVRSVGSGNFASRVVVRSNDEFGELAHAVNQMVEGLEERESLKGALVHYVRSQAADSKLAVESGEPAGEQRTERKITVLVADLVGFENLSEQLGSDRLFSLLNEYFSTMIDAVLRHRGSLEKSSNRDVIAVFGALAEDPHQERRAVETALEMQDALARLLQKWKTEVGDADGALRGVYLEIAIHTAPAVVAAGAVDQLEFESVERVVKLTGRIKSVGLERNNRLTVSADTAGNLYHTFPMTPVETDASGLELFRIEMPQTSLK